MKQKKNDCNDTITYNKTRGQVILGRMKKNREIYLMLIPVMLFFIIFSYVPMYGILIAWKDYLPKKGIIGSNYWRQEYY